ncbi:MAG: hypothetical protein RIQ60_2139 [Pseudomonadota bacterium]|jgi:GT2 family glycosyltransferase
MSHPVSANNLRAEMQTSTEECLMSIVVLSWQKFDRTTGPCLASLMQQGLALDSELIVVDNGSTDGAAQACERAVDELKQDQRHAGAAIEWLPLAANLGFGGGMNAGVARSSGRWLVLVNSDTVWPANALARLREILIKVQHSHPTLAMLGPVTNAAGNGQALHLPGATHAECLRVGEQAMASGLNMLLSPTYRTDFFVAIIRRDAWMALQGLDPVFGRGYYEDFDFSLRLRAAGFEQCIAEDLFVAHVGSASFGSKSAEQEALIRRNRGIFKARHPHALLQHQRLGNAQALGQLLDHAERVGWTDALKARAAWRAAMLRDGLPRSPFKRLWWQLTQRDLWRRLTRHGIEPAYPDRT